MTHLENKTPTTYLLQEILFTSTKLWCLKNPTLLIDCWSSSFISLQPWIQKSESQLVIIKKIALYKSLDSKLWKDRDVPCNLPSLGPWAKKKSYTKFWNFCCKLHRLQNIIKKPVTQFFTPKFSSPRRELSILTWNSPICGLDNFLPQLCTSSGRRLYTFSSSAPFFLLLPGCVYSSNSGNNFGLAKFDQNL